jgi:hypothetical protein
MIILLPNTSIQTISIMPRKVLVSGSNVVLSIRRDGDGLSENIIPSSIASNGNFTELSISSTILSEGSTYFIEITIGGLLAYRDKVYSTTQNDYKVKHRVSQSEYTAYGTTDDNTYIV